MYTIQIFQDKNNAWRWRLVAGENILAVSTDGYESKDDLLQVVTDVSREIPQCPIVDDEGQRHFRRHDEQYVTLTIPRPAAIRLNQAYNLAALPGYNPEAGASIRSRAEHAQNVAEALNRFLDQ